MHIGKESYNSLNYIYLKFAHKLLKLKDNGFVNKIEIIWLVKFFLTKD
ncbi:22348_t:CDS:2 [Cetraspora pellucida]|uniref:22348_t:CDS:1 n=1 Tax=Cetraspora pellucida TaxID=1433469 RepID=A0A9N8YYD8_9GLOM|nr:22348_t:CDS:2 [Cetraspora pellucida]